MRAVSLLLILVAVMHGAEGPCLWSLGAPNRDAREFSLAPDGAARYDRDPCFLVGTSDPATDWPYVLPGPNDDWGGKRSHTGSIVFVLDAVASQGDGRLLIDLVDTHADSPPLLQVCVNGHQGELLLPKGGGNSSIKGKPEAGKPYQAAVEVPVAHLQRGVNRIDITNAKGGWLIYDAIRLLVPEGTRLGHSAAVTAISRVAAIRGLVEKEGRYWQPIAITLRHAGAIGDGELRCGDVSAPLHVTAGDNVVRMLVPAWEQEREVVIEAILPGQRLHQRVVVKPVRKLAIHVLNHSHTDIGYTTLQPEVEKKQVENLLTGIAYARATADHPPGSRFIWNVEAGWVADLYQRRLAPAQRAAYDEAVKKGWVSPQGLYLNVLTGLCRPEELIRTCRFAIQESQRLGVVVDSAMISDVPGCTWGMVSVLSQAGIRYFSVAPNNFDRIGDILVQWEDKPFWWVSPSGRERVLVWIPWRGYGLAWETKALDEEFMARYQDHLAASGYPYDITYVRWAGSRGDNAVPERQPTDFAKEWNATYAWPKLVISSTSETFAALEQRHGSRLPEVHGDWTPYWEDGAGSSAAETALNRSSSERLSQAQAICAIRDPAIYRPDAYADTWNAIMLYSEHTWGASGSITHPESPMTKNQWAIKQGYALDADKRSRELLAQALGEGSSAAIDVYNTCSWMRTDVVVVTRECSTAGDRVLDASGNVAPSQRLASGGLCFLVRDIPGLSARRYTIAAGAAECPSGIAVTEDGLDNGLVRVRLDRTTGAIAEFGGKGIAGNLADSANGHAPNDYLYIIGDKVAEAQRNNRVVITVKEKGPLVATLAVDSDAPGCRHLRREIRVIAGLDRIELDDLIDKERILGQNGYRHRSGKESVNIAFPFAVSGGQMWYDTPFAVVRPDRDLMPSACKNWFSVGRWVEVANQDHGVTWATLDAPLIQIGGITATLLNSQTNPAVWRKTVEPTQAFYVWAMNNHWGTNYRAYQEGPVTLRFALRPHRGNDLAASARFGNGYGQPLIAAPAGGTPPTVAPRLSLSSDEVQVSGFKPSEDGKGWIVRLFNTTGKDCQVTLTWNKPEPTALWSSDSSETCGRRIKGFVFVPAWGLVTVRADR